MQGSSLLLAFAATEIVASFMPGPAVLTVASIALSGSLRGMAGAVAGINATNLLWYVMVGVGLIALVHSFPLAFVLLRWIGTAYLLWLGIQTWRHPTHLSMREGQQRKGFTRGFASAAAVQISNPKALVFFTVFLPPFIDLHRPVAPQLVTLAIIGISIEVIALCCYGLLAYHVGKLVLPPRTESWIARGSGAILIAIALAMALSRTL